MTHAGVAGPLLASTSGVILLCAALALWHRATAGIVRALALQGAALAASAVILGVSLHKGALLVTASLILVVKAMVIPFMLRRMVRLDPSSSETDPVVNVPASLVVSVLLTFVAFVASRPMVYAIGGALVALAPYGFATVLIGFFVLVSRRKAIAQMVGIVLIDNGTGLVALLLTTGMPLLTELGSTLDVLLMVVVFRVLAARIYGETGTLDLDSLEELRD